MKLIKRNPNLGYLDTMLWVPKTLLNVDGVKRALEFELNDRDSVRVLRLWEEAEHHLIVPRAFWRPGALAFDCIDCRPTHYNRTDVKSKIRLDFKPIHGKLQPTGDTVQADAIKALLASNGGVLQLACVSGDTVIQLNRGGKGFKMTIAEAHKRFIGDPSTRGPKWNLSSPTYIRANIGGRIGLQEVANIVFSGLKMTYEIRLADGKKLRLTRDHQVLTTRGFVSIDEGLKPGDLVVTDSGQEKWGKKTVSTRKCKPIYKRLSWYPSHPHAYKNGTKRRADGTFKRVWALEEHRAMAEARLNGLSLEQFRDRCSSGKVRGLKFIDPKKFHVHHKDENHKNNSLDNLEVLPIAEHMAEHQPGAGAFGYGVPTPVRITAISEGRFEEVYDVSCAAPHHNFVANGMVVHNCGKGKTIVALHLASLLQVPTLIVVDNTHLMEQWRNEIATHLSVPGGVGLIQGQVKDWQKNVVMATYHSLANWAETIPEEVRRWFGLVIWDEGHHISAPTFSKSAPLFYGYRLALTATPKRQDGTHVICQHHIGEVIFKDLIQKSPPKIYFKWTGFELDFEDAQTRSAVCDKNGEVHLGKLAGHFGASRQRMNEVVLPEVKRLVDAGHKVIVLSNSVDEVINLHALWTTGDKNAPLYTDIPYPTSLDVGESLAPTPLEKDQLHRALRFVTDIKKNLNNNPNMPKAKREVAQDRLQKYEELLASYEVWKKTEKEMRRRQRAYLKELLAMKSTSGIFTEAVAPKERFQMLRTRQVIFAIMKYGREGLDDKLLSAVLVSEPISDRNTLQQIMGRPRDKSNSVLIFLEDNIGPLIGQCQKLRSHLRDWPTNEGGPFKYEQLNHPSVTRRQGNTWNAQTPHNLLRKPGLRVIGS